jgi:hypothetical protein
MLSPLGVIAKVAFDDPKQGDVGRLICGDAVEIAHGVFR